MVVNENNRTQNLAQTDENRNEAVKININGGKDLNNTQKNLCCGYNTYAIVKSSLLLLGPLFMGLIISSIGNDEYIKRDFFFMHYNNGSINENNFDSSLFPASIWSFGFLFPFGGWFGSLIGAMTVDRYGRKYPSIFFCFCGVIGALFKIFSRYVSVAMLFSGRFFDGIAASGLMVSAILLMFETLPERLISIFKPLIQISVNLGILLMSALSMYSVVGYNWNMVHIATLIIIILLGFVVFILPESPKFVYLSKNNPSKTENILKELRGNNYDPKELKDLEKIASETKNMKQMTILQFLAEKRFRLATASLIVLHLGQQLSGINSIMAFAPSFFKTSGFSSPDVPGVIVISIGLMGSIVFAPFVGKMKRKILWITGFVFMAISFGGFLIAQEYNFASYWKLIFLGLFVFMFQIGPGPVCWFISVEMYPSNANGAAQGVAGFFNWFANTLVFWLFPILEDKLKYNVLIIFIVFQVIVIVYSLLFVVETFKRTSNEVLDDYARKTCF